MILFVKAHCFTKEQSISMKLYDAFLESYISSHPRDEVVELDLFQEDLPYYQAEMIDGMAKLGKGERLTPEEGRATRKVNGYLEQFLAADKAVFAFPLWNFTVPAPLHTYMDYLSQPGKMFRFTEDGPVGMVSGKKAAILNARGSDFSEEPMASQEMAVNFVSTNLNLYGVTDITKVVVEGHNENPDQSETLIRQGIEEAAAAGQRF